MYVVHIYLYVYTICGCDVGMVMICSTHAMHKRAAAHTQLLQLIHVHVFAQENRLNVCGRNHTASRPYCGRDSTHGPLESKLYGKPLTSTNLLRAMPDNWYCGVSGAKPGIWTVRTSGQVRQTQTHMNGNYIMQHPSFNAATSDVE